MKKFLSICAIVVIANAGIDSVGIDESGNIKLKATSEDVMKIGDVRDKQACLKRAELKAKADIAKFFKEQITSKDVIDELSQQTENAKIEAGAESETINRDVIVNETTQIQNNAEAALRGVVVIEKIASVETKECSVTVGFNSKTLKVAEAATRAMQKSMSGDTEVINSNGISVIKSNNNSSSRSGIEKAQSSSKRSSMYDEF
ncbi:hypothetical protein CBLAS_1391 [Campylobacter blaseri]|uniref:Uncharacterized protein n=1 Tax=Campylobacter blaseri TaxID=2042961 RepID=A0A2P8QYX6_9BACT|nr:hypothetical protein [Campylobacter blaseri]PSM51439.1 hypothetical protein CQ405_07660 [Campylobacter blaseri]PSM52888.1 hypothetical protein CRN67_07665 [Campylobacter blaseri]QKF86557.1 hypothetical protein CBLAS_1391 [Campylobacter blaseri]